MDRRKIRNHATRLKGDISLGPKLFMTTRAAVDPALFALDPETIFLNHGSFGGCPVSVLKHQNELRLRLESQPVQFFQRDYEPLRDEALAVLGEFVGADKDDLVFVPNATEGVNTVVRSLPLRQGDEILVSNHEYNACRNAIEYAAEKRGATVVVVDVPYPLASEDQVLEAIASKVSKKTRLALFDHVTSHTGLIMPIKRIIDYLAERGIDTLVDGAHAPGMVPLSINALGAAYYTGNCHKWMCGPKSAAFLHVRRDKQSEVRPLTISHGANSPRTDRSKFQIEFGWMGTRDPSSALTVPYAIEYMGGLLSGGWAAIMESNRRLALAGREVIQKTLGIAPPSPDSMIGSLASIPLASPHLAEPSQSIKYQSNWQETLITRHNIEVPLFVWPSRPSHIVRISAQVYNDLSQYEFLAERLKELSAGGQG